MDREDRLGTKAEDKMQDAGKIDHSPRRQFRRRVIAKLRPIVWLVPFLALSLVGAYLLRFDGVLSPQVVDQMTAMLPIVVCVKTAAFVLAGITLSCHSFVSLHDAFRLFRAAFAATACVACVDLMFSPDQSMPRGVIVTDGCLTTLLVGGFLTARRIHRERRESKGSRTHARPVLIAGGPVCVELIARAMRGGAMTQYYPKGILTPVDKMLHRAIHGIPVLGSLEQIEEVAKQQDCHMVLLSSGDLPGSKIRELLSRGEACGVEIRVVPDVARIVSGKIDVRPREVAIEDLLGRPAVDIDQSELKDWLAGKRLLVTGSCGSIGSELVRQLLNFDPAQVVLVDRSENGQFQLGLELAEEIRQQRAELLIADVTDSVRMNSIFRRYQPQIVFHAAAYKHVPLMEENPGEGIKNIVGATKLLADLANASGVETFVMISTDKAVNPTSVMGCCKRVAELYTQNIASRSTCRFVTVRFGNVLGSAGSVVPVFRKQIAAGGPVTITHPDMTRFFMTIPEASQLVLQASGMGKGGEIFVLDMGTPVKIMDLAKDMIRLSGLRLGHDIDIVVSGLRPGEKLYEELYASDERQLPTLHEKILVAEGVQINRQQLLADIQTLLQLTTADGFTIRQQLKAIVPGYVDDSNEPTTKPEFATTVHSRAA